MCWALNDLKQRLQNPSHPTHRGASLTGFDVFLQLPKDFSVTKPAFLVLQYFLNVLKKVLAALEIRQECWSSNDVFDVRQMLRTFPENKVFSVPAKFPNEWNQHAQQLDTFIDDLCKKTARNLYAYLEADGGAVWSVLEQLGISLGSPISSWNPVNKNCSVTHILMFELNRKLSRLSSLLFLLDFSKKRNEYKTLLLHSQYLVLLVLLRVTLAWTSCSANKNH